MTTDRIDDALGPWCRRPGHRAWLEARADALFDLFATRTLDPAGGFRDLDPEGQPSPTPVRSVHIAARMAHCFVLGALRGRPGAAEMVDHAMRFLWTRHRDPVHGGYVWSVGPDGPVDATKQGYGHAFVLLAASSALAIGHPLAQPMLDDVSEILDTRFWDPAHGAIAEEFGPDWTPVPGYRGQNSNMHLTEALMGAFEATGDRLHLERAERIAERIIQKAAAGAGWRVPEHFTEDWVVDPDYRGNEMFRPSGTTPGHALEWARLLLQLWCLGGWRHEWMPGAAQGLFARAVATGWDGVHGGLFYTLDWQDQPAKRLKLWWPICEGIGAAHFLAAHLPDPMHEASYRQFWNTIARAFLDHRHGGWIEECTEDLRPSFTIFPGKGDIYHALQACLIPLYPAIGSLVAVIGNARAHLTG